MMFNWRFAAAILPILAHAAWTTVWLTGVSFALALAAGLPLLALRRSSIPVLARTTALGIDFIRSTPLLVQLFFLYFVLPGIGITLTPIQTGILALAVHYGCYMSEVYRAGLEAVPAGQWDAVTALGFSRFEAYRSILLPQAIPPIIPVAVNYLVHMFKDTPLLASISVVELMFVSAQIGADRFRYLEPISICGLLFLAMSLASAQLGFLAESFVGRRWRRKW